MAWRSSIRRHFGRPKRRRQQRARGRLQAKRRSLYPKVGGVRVRIQSGLQMAGGTVHGQGKGTWSKQGRGARVEVNGARLGDINRVGEARADGEIIRRGMEGAELGKGK